jgi:hypothetical protein
MRPVVDKDFLERSNAALAQVTLWGGFGICVVAALVFDLRRWLM